VLVALAARVGATRLIDNVVLSVRDGEVHADRGVRICSEYEHRALAERGGAI
jgi:hypothetical protein